MPYVSQAQAGKFHTDPALKKYAPEFDAAAKGMHLPKKVGGPKPTRGKGKLETMFGKK